MTRAHSPAGTRPPWRSRPSWFFQRPDDRLNTLPQPVREVPGRLLILAGRADQGQGEVRACEEVLGLLTGQALIGDDGSAGAGRLAGWPVSICRACSRSPKSLGFARPNPVRRPRKATWRHPKADLRYRRLLARWRQPALVTERDIKRDRADSRTQIIGFCVPGGMIGDPRWDAPGHRRGGRARSGSCFGSVAGGMAGVCLGVFLDCCHGPQVFLVEAADDESAEGAGDGGHGDVQDQPAAHPGAGVLRLE